VTHADLILGPAELSALLIEQFPAKGGRVFISRCDTEALVACVELDAHDLRPGGSVSGPALMSAVDTAAYLLLLSRFGAERPMYTSHLSIHFLEPPVTRTLWVKAWPLRLSQRTGIANVEVRGAEVGSVAGFSTVTYSILPQR
jgi:acyl-coenzyme A thioesterase PaaI-like protein